MKNGACVLLLSLSCGGCDVSQPTKSYVHDKDFALHERQIALQDATLTAFNGDCMLSAPLPDGRHLFVHYLDASACQPQTDRPKEPR